MDPSIDPELVVCDDNGVDVDEDIKGDDDEESDVGRDIDVKTGLNINNACLKPGLNSQS